MLPRIGVAATAAFMLATVVEPILMPVMLACAAGIAGAVFPVGTAVARAHPLERRGRALATCGVGALLGTVAATMIGPTVFNGDPNRLVLATGAVGRVRGRGHGAGP